MSLYIDSLLIFFFYISFDPLIRSLSEVDHFFSCGFCGSPFSNQQKMSKKCVKQSRFNEATNDPNDIFHSLRTWKQSVENGRFSTEIRKATYRKMIGQASELSTTASVLAAISF